MNSITTYTSLWLSCLLMLLVITGCDSSITSEDQSADKATLNAVMSSNQTVTDPAIRATLADVKKATARYHKVSRAESDGYQQSSPFVPNMGYHYVNFGLLDGTIDPIKPEALVYVDNPARDDKRRLVAVEYIVPFSVIPSESDPSLLDGKFPGVDGDTWHKEEEISAWTLHAWIWYPNSEGVFHPTNPRVGSGS